MSAEQKVEQKDICPEFAPLGKDTITKAWGGSKEGICEMCLEDVESGLEEVGLL